MMPNNLNYLSNLLSSFNKFKSDFQGDPRQKVQELLNSGQMTPQQFDELQVMAKQFESLLR